MRYSFLPEADAELREATNWYEGRRDGLGGEFMHEVERAIQRILDSPQGHTPLGRDTRICRLKRFQYGLVYVVDDVEITIVAVMHLHRRPGYWKKRLK